MDNRNRGITIEDIAGINDNPRSFRWNHWNGRIPLYLDPLEKIDESEVLLYRPELIIIYNKVLKRQRLGYDDNYISVHGTEQLHEDYVMCVVIDGTSGYVAYRIHPPNGFILDEIYVNVHLPHSKGRFKGFLDHTIMGVMDQINSPIEQRTRTLNQFIEDLGGWVEEPFVFGEGNNLYAPTTPSDETQSLISGAPFTQISDVSHMKELYDGGLIGANEAARFLTTFKMFLDELGITYRRQERLRN